MTKFKEKMEPGFEMSGLKESNIYIIELSTKMTFVSDSSIFDTFTEEEMKERMISRIEDGNYKYTVHKEPFWKSTEEQDD